MTERPEQLISLFLQNPSVMTAGQMQELSTWVSRDRANTRDFIEATLFYRSIHDVLLGLDEERNKLMRDEVSLPEATVESFFNRQFWDVLLKEETTAPKVEINPVSEPVVEIIQKVKREKIIRKINKTTLLTLAVSAAAMIFLTVYIRLAPPAPYEVATISDSIGAEWSSDEPVDSGRRIVSNSRPIRLTAGIVKLETDDQVQVVLEAPTEFTFRSSSEIAMNYGKLFARVSRQGSGFSVITPNSKIVDLGTEFGVLSHIDGNTEVHMYKGKANIFAGEKNQPKISEILTAGLARKVDSHDSSIQEIKLEERALVRNIDSKSKFVWKGQPIYLADLLLGGNGFGSASAETVEFDPANGNVVSVGVSGYRKGTGGILPIKNLSYLDSIFVPGSGDGDVIIDSAGHRFAECPTTSGLYYSNIICGKSCVFFDTVEQVFKKVRRQTENFGYLYCHSNMGLTIDIDAVRQAVPGLQISSFSAFAGIVNLWNNAPNYSEADIWVLVDGQLRASRKGLTSDQGFDIHIDIKDTDRFLTLAVTDGQTVQAEGFPANHMDTCGFVEPRFELILSTD